MMNLLTKLRGTALGVLFPLHCLGCGKEGKSLCETCLSIAPPLSSPYCEVCANPGVGNVCDWCLDVPLQVDGIRAPYLYVEDGLIHRAIIDLKFNNLRALAPELGQLLADYLSANPIPGDVIVPVPCHSKRVRQRGFNQAALIAKQLGKLTGLPVNEKLLTRVKNNPSQLQMSGREQRWKNVEGNFATVGSADDLRVLLVDDLTTTGSTMSACAGELKNAGASEVWGLAVARTA